MNLRAISSVATRLVDKLSAELRAALTANREAAATRFTAADWTLSLASIVRLRPGLGDRKGLRAGQLGIVVRIDREVGTIRLTRGSRYRNVKCTKSKFRM